jgi:hypothetical protein
MKPLRKHALQLTVLVAVFLATAVAVHWRDDAQESRDIKALVAKYDDLGYSNLLAAYVGNASIAQAIQSGKAGAAQCEADLRASAQYGLLRACLARPTCAAGIVDLARKDAPELLANGPTPFRRFKDGEVCTPKDDHQAS